MRSVPNYHHSYTFAFIFLVLIMFHAFSISANTLSATKSITISSNKIITSPNEIFELGFFNPGSSSRWYLGIWYKKIPTRTYVWVANRDNPLPSSIGTLKISDNNLVIFDQFDTHVWSTNLTGGVVSFTVVAELLGNGNLVLRDSDNKNSDGFLWQSFDFPTDTLLPEMKLGWDLKTGINRFLRSWKTSDNPSSRDFSTKLETRGFPEFYVSNRESILYWSGPWNGVGFSSVPVMKQVDYFVNNFTATNEEVAYSYRISKTNVYSRLSLSSAGLLQRLTWIEAAQSWKQLWYSPNGLCDNYKECGNYGYCDSNTSPVCNCIKGFVPRNEQTWALRDDSVGCVRKTKLSCDSRDGFVRLKKMKLPDTTATTVDRGFGMKECEERCLNYCNCTAFANTDIRNGGSGCVIWTGEILDIRNYAKGGQDLYVKLAAANLDKTRRSNLNWQKRFDITNGIARGLLYLHQDSRFRIIHRDLKASNVLLDKNMTPKISDFGMARIFGRDETEANTRKVVGTYGYMSPEYAMNGIFSMKSDVFSFGVLLLEIISGKRSTGFYNSTGDLSLLGCVWRNWKEGKGLEIVDPIIIDSSSSTFRTHEVLRCIQIGLLCVQERAEDRPVMSSVMVMLGSETTTIPQPKRPGFCIGRSPLETDSSKQHGDEWTVNQITLSVIDAR